MTSSLVVTRREDAVLYVGLNRPEKRNAIHRDLLLALVDAVAAAERDRDVRAVIVYGEGPVFSAGVDFGMLAGDVEGESRAPFRTHVGEMQAALSRLEAIEKPVIGALHRYVPGLGLELALAFDLRVATSDCELGLPEVRLGLVPDVGGTTRLVRTVGYAKAKELIMTGRMIPAAEAAAIGLVNQVVPPGDHVAAFLDRVRDAPAADPFLPSALAKLVPIEKTVRIDPRNAAATLAEAAGPFLDRLAGGSFFVRIERRGLKGQLHSPTLEREVADPIWRALESRGVKPRVEFHDPDNILVIETVGGDAGLAVLGRALRHDYPFVKVR